MGRQQLEVTVGSFVKRGDRRGAQGAGDFGHRSIEALEKRWSPYVAYLYGTAILWYNHGQFFLNAPLSFIGKSLICLVASFFHGGHHSFSSGL